MKRLIIIVMFALCLCNISNAGDYIRLGASSVLSNTANFDLEFSIERTCPDPEWIRGASNGFVMEATGAVTWTFKNLYQDPFSSVQWNLGGLMYTVSGMDGISPDTFLTGGAAMPPVGMPVMGDEPYFHFVLDIGCEEGEICFDSAYAYASGVWKWAGLTCGEGGDPERPLFVDVFGSDGIHPICMTVEHLCTTPTINVTPPGNLLSASHCDNANYTFGADPGIEGCNPATPLRWFHVSGIGAIDVNTGDYVAPSSAIGTYPVTIMVVNSCDDVDYYSFTVEFTNSAPQFTNCTGAPTAVVFGDTYYYDFAASDPDPCDGLDYTLLSYSPGGVAHEPAINPATGEFVWQTIPEEVNLTVCFEIRVEDLDGAGDICVFCVTVVEPPDFYVKDCSADNGSGPYPSPCSPYWTYYAEHNISNMYGHHGRRWLPGDWNHVHTVVRNRGGQGEGTVDDNTARLFAYWHEGAAGLRWPPSPSELDLRRITHDPIGLVRGAPYAPQDFVEVEVRPWDAPSVQWVWLAPRIEDLAYDADHICVGYVINPDGPSGEPENELPPSGDYDRAGSEDRTTYNNNIAQINLATHRVSTSGPKSEPEIVEFTIPVWNSSDSPALLQPQLNIVAMCQGWSAETDTPDSLYVEPDTCEFVNLYVTVPADAPHIDSSIIDVEVIDLDQNEMVGGIRFEVRVDNAAPEPVMNLQTLCADHMPNCCPPWVPPEVCWTMGAKVPLQWDVPDDDEMNGTETVWFFIVCRSITPDVDLDDQIDSVAADHDLADPAFQWIDNTVGRAETYYYCVYAVDEAGNISQKSNVVAANMFACGDADGSGEIDIDDGVYLIAYIFLEGPEPIPWRAGDVNCDGQIDIDDVVYLIGYIFMEGPPPCSNCGESAARTKGVNGSAEVHVTNDSENSVGSVDVSILSNTDVQGVQLEFAIDGDVSNIEAISEVDGLDLFSGRSGNQFRVGLLDLLGQHMIPSDGMSVLRISYSGSGRVVLEDQIVVAKGGGKLLSSTMKETDEEVLPTGFDLHQNYPNPFNPSTEISFSLSKPSHVSLVVYNVAGQRVAELINRHMEAGTHAVTWNGQSSDGDPVASGVYFYRIDAAEYSETRKMLLLK